MEIKSLLFYIHTHTHTEYFLKLLNNISIFQAIFEKYLVSRLLESVFYYM